MDLQKTATGISVIPKPPAKPFFCAFRDGKTPENRMPCEVLGCTGVFQKMPPMVDEQLAPCYKDSRTGKSGGQIQMEMRENVVVPLKKVS